MIVFIIALIAIIIFFKNFYAFVYFVCATDIFLRIVTYLKTYILRDDAFGFFDFIPANIPAMINGYNLGIFNDILMALYVIVYIVFEVLVISRFFNKKF